MICAPPAAEEFSEALLPGRAGQQRFRNPMTTSSWFDRVSALTLALTGQRSVTNTDG